VEDQGIALLLTTPGCGQDTTEEAVYQGQVVTTLLFMCLMLKRRRDILIRASKQGWKIRMPWCEEHRKAVCGSTARTV
jgi:hypothetical protein